MFLAWSLLITAISMEVASTLSLKAAGDGSVPALVFSTVGYAGSLAILLFVLKKIDVSIAYAVWAGAGTAAVALIGMTALGEAVSPLKVLSVLLVIMGVVGLNLSGA